ncbi:MAG: hypothetical protein QM610_00555 [Chitinophagaceae bacterium]
MKQLSFEQMERISAGTKDGLGKGVGCLLEGAATGVALAPIPFLGIATFLAYTTGCILLARG